MKEKTIDWSKDQWKEMIIEQRKFLWAEDTIDKIAQWAGLKQGIVAVDAGCGLGYLGWTYWKYFGENGKYFGIDRSENLISEAQDISTKWAIGGEASFQTGNVYQLPFEDNFADLVMCQTLLMHLEDPQKALQEMKRILKPNGILLCKEPDNLSSSMKIGFSTIPDIDLETRLDFIRYNLICYEGHKKLGRGDYAIANKLPLMLDKAGFRAIDMRANDLVHFMIPPYETPKQTNSKKKYPQEY